MLLQKSVKGVIGQMEDGGGRLGPRHLWALWLWGPRAAMGKWKKGRGELGTFQRTRHITTALPSSGGEQKSKPAAEDAPPSGAHAHQWSKGASPLSAERSVASGFTKRWINRARIP